jgi:hypothetical protein
LNSTDILGIFKTDAAIVDQGLNKYLDFHKNASLCDQATTLINKTELCTMVDDGIPSQGFIQSYYRVVKYLERAYFQLQQKDFVAETLLLDPEFVEMDYAFENVYFPGQLFFEHEMKYFLRDFLSINAVEVIDKVVILTVMFIFLSLFFTVPSFMIIHEKT